MGALEELKKEVASDLILKKQYEIETEIYNIAICLKRIRKEKKLTQKDVAQRTGLMRIANIRLTYNRKKGAYYG